MVTRRASIAAFLTCLLAAAVQGGVNRWTEGGPPRATECSFGALPCSEVAAIALDPFDENILYAILYTGSLDPEYRHSLWRSEDGGESWTRLRFRSRDVYDPLLSLAISPNDPQTMYVLSRQKFFRSADGGNTWTESTLPEWYVWNTAMAVAPANGNTIYVGQEKSCGFGVCIDGGVYRSDDGGRRWREAGLEHQTIASLATDPSDPSTVYAVTNEGRLFQSRNRGGSWSDVGPKGAPVTMVAVDPVSSSTLYATPRGTNPLAGIYKSADRGKSWRLIEGENLGGGGHNIITIDAIHSMHLLATSGFGTVIRSTNGGETWTRLHDGITGPPTGIDRIGGPVQLLIAPSGWTFHAVYEGGHVFHYQLVPPRRRAVRK